MALDICLWEPSELSYHWSFPWLTSESFFVSSVKHLIAFEILQFNKGLLQSLGLFHVSFLDGLFFRKSGANTFWKISRRIAWKNQVAMSNGTDWVMIEPFVRITVRRGFALGDMTVCHLVKQDDCLELLLGVWSRYWQTWTRCFSETEIEWFPVEDLREECTESCVVLFFKYCFIWSGIRFHVLCDRRSCVSRNA